MKIELQNIGMISKASIDIRGISLIAGPNDSGKSTIGKVLYSIFRAINISENDFISIKDKSAVDEAFSIFQQIARYSEEKILSQNNKIISFLTAKKDISEVILSLSELVEDIENIEAKEAVKKRIGELESNYKLKFDDKKVIVNELELYLNDSFNNGLKNKFSKTKKSSILLEELSKLKIEITESINISGETDFLFNDVIFIESPLVIKNPHSRNRDYTRDYETYLLEKINNTPIEESLFNNRENLKRFFDKIQEIISGKISQSKGLRNQLLYSKNGMDFSMNNTATGIKTFGIIQLLLENGSLNEKTLLIIDEPEVHLHPKWQVKFAEILVLMSKELNIQMLLTSHSPYFIEAIEVFSKKYNYSQQTNFYCSEKSKNGLSSEIIDVTKELSKIYAAISDASYSLKKIEHELK